MKLQLVFLAHGGTVTLTCPCGRQHTIKRPQAANCTLFECETCGYKVLYQWPPR